MTARWPTREARDLVSRYIAKGPRRRVRVWRWQDTDEVYAGADVVELRRLYRLAEPPVDTPEWSAWLANNPQALIAQAIEQHNRKDAA